jgi:hypothetical protein
MGQTSYSAPGGGSGGTNWWLQNGDLSISPIAGVNGIEITPSGGTGSAMQFINNFFQMVVNSVASFCGLQSDGTGINMGASDAAGVFSSQFSLNPTQTLTDTTNSTTTEAGRFAVLIGQVTGEVEDVAGNRTTEELAITGWGLIHNGTEVFGIVNDGKIQTNQVQTGAATPIAAFTKYVQLYDLTGAPIARIVCV